MGILRKNQFIVWNLFALILVKAIFSYPGPQFASLIDSVSDFTKEEIVSQTNALRSFAGIAPLKDNPTLDLAASQKLRDMIQGQYFAHTSPTGVSPWHWFEANKYNFAYAGENLAIGFWSANDTVKAWAASQSHRDNLLNSNFKDIGVAIAPAKIRDSRGFLVVQLFGAQKIKAKPASKTVTSSRPVSPSLASQNAQPEIKNLQPTIINAADLSGRFDKAAKILNNAFALYALALFVVSLLLLIFVGISRSLLVKTTVGLALFILALVIPVIQAAYPALII